MTTSRDTDYHLLRPLAGLLRTTRTYFSAKELSTRATKLDRIPKILDLAIAYNILWVDYEKLAVYDKDLSVGENVVKSNWTDRCIRNKLFIGNTVSDNSAIRVALAASKTDDKTVGLRDFMAGGRTQDEASKIIVRSLLRGNLRQTFNSKGTLLNRYKVADKWTSPTINLEPVKQHTVKHDDGFESTFAEPGPPTNPRPFTREVFVYKTENMEWFKDIVTDLQRVSARTIKERDIIHDAHRFEHAMLLAQFPTSTVQTLQPNAQNELYCKGSQFASISVKWNLGPAFLVMVPGATYLGLTKKSKHLSRYLFQHLEYKQSILG
jgi:hypothetical protein